MKKRYLIGLGLAAILILAAKFGPEKSIGSPGVLAKNHGDIACDGCHSGFDSFENNDKCVECHEDNALTPVEMFATSRCNDCHSDHMGKDADLTAVSARECQRCHDPATAHARAPIELAEKLSTPPMACLDCHGNHEEHRRHAEPALALVRDNLAGAHRRGNPLFHKDTCDKCHQDMATASSLTAATREGFFDPHVTHVGRLEIRCTWCHTDVDIRQGGGKRARKLADVERCVQCHAGEYFPAQANAAPTKSGGGT